MNKKAIYCHSVLSHMHTSDDIGTNTAFTPTSCSVTNVNTRQGSTDHVVQDDWMAVRGPDGILHIPHAIGSAVCLC